MSIPVRTVTCRIVKHAQNKTVKTNKHITKGNFIPTCVAHNINLEKVLENYQDKSVIFPFSEPNHNNDNLSNSELICFFYRLWQIMYS